jgi:hypothetical protein
MMLSKRQRKIFIAIMIIAGLALVFGSFLPFLSAF